MNIDEQIEVQVGFKSGKKIESSEKNIEFWEKDISPVWNFGIRKYRIKEDVPKRWRAEEGENYYYVSSRGKVIYCQDIRGVTAKKNYAKGNYFETEEQARASAIFFILNDKYEYSFPWMEDKPEVPEVYEYWTEPYNEWRIGHPSNRDTAKKERIIRWLKHPNGEGE